MLIKIHFSNYVNTIPVEELQLMISLSELSFTEMISKEPNNSNSIDKKC